MDYDNNNHDSEIWRESGADKDIVKVREAKLAYRKFHTLCFWSFDPDLQIGAEDVSWIVECLRKNGNRDAWETAVRLS